LSNPYEITGTAFGLLSVWLTIRKSIWCWPTGLVNVVLFFVMFYQVKLYAELITYSVFFVLGIYGWWEWSHGGENRTKRTGRLVARPQSGGGNGPCPSVSSGSSSASSSRHIVGTNT
jgi:nicotinamide mononucleotide transporter